MSELQIRSLFQSLVVMGASLTACGGRAAATGPGSHVDSGGSASNDGGTPAHAGASGAAAGAIFTINPAACEAVSQWTCDRYDTNSNCRCETAAPRGPQDCENPFQFQCESEWIAGNLERFGYGCRCDPAAVTPTRCAHPEQFTCGHFGNYYSDCYCNPELILSVDDCVDAGCGSFRCQSELPRYGCNCGDLACLR